MFNDWRNNSRDSIYEQILFLLQSCHDSDIFLKEDNVVLQWGGALSQQQLHLNDIPEAIPHGVTKADYHATDESNK